MGIIAESLSHLIISKKNIKGSREFYLPQKYP